MEPAAPHKFKQICEQGIGRQRARGDVTICVCVICICMYVCVCLSVYKYIDRGRDRDDRGNRDSLYSERQLKK